VIVPDLPGFGASTRDVPDYSIEAHARYVLQLLDARAVEQVHLVGFSMGGGVALHVYELAPHRVVSVSMLSAIGVQELELFGDYRMNHAVHGAQLAALWLVREGSPHFGALDDAMLGVPYARNFFDSDQRPLRGILKSLDPPMLILHGEEDFLVPVEVAYEHQRIVPHSRLELLDGSHFLVFNRGEELAGRIDAFLDDVEIRAAPARSQAGAARLALAELPFDPGVIPPASGVALLLLIVLIAVATLVSEDLTCIGVGLMIAQGRIEFVPGLFGCFVGIFVGDLLLYAAGRVLGRPALDRPPLSWWLRPEQVELSSDWFRRRGAIVIGLSRFVPGTRLPTYFAAGMLRTGLWSFTFYFFLAVALWTPLLVGLSMVIGERAFGYFESLQRHLLPALLLIGMWILVMVKLILPALTLRGRRRLVGAWRRAVRWEFWPPWVFYPPVLLYVLWLGLKARAPLLFTAANPAIPAGGFIAESKWEILQGLTGAGERLARTARISAEIDYPERRRQALEFMERHGLDYPVVLKPDAGQRGSGVAVVRDARQLSDYLKTACFETLIQEYVPGDEFGIFYAREPARKAGRIFSVTEKRMPSILGDGLHTVEELVLLDRRAVALATIYLAAQAHQLGRVPGPGEEIRLVELGTHCRGAIFLDGSSIVTDELTAAIDEISRSYDGFFFGRYDLRTPSVEALRHGERFKIIELNGVTSEATHIYDPGLGLLEAYRTLCEQWRIAFEIGRQNRERGHPQATVGELFELIRRYRRDSRTHPG